MDLLIVGWPGHLIMIKGGQRSSAPLTRRRGGFGIYRLGPAPMVPWTSESPLSHSPAHQIVLGSPPPIWPILQNFKAKLALGNPSFMNVSVRFLVLITGLEKWCVLSKISFYTSYCNWLGSCRSSLAAGKKWLYVMGQRVIRALGESLLQKSFLNHKPWFMCAGWGFWLGKEEGK